MLYMLCALDAHCLYILALVLRFLIVSPRARTLKALTDVQLSKIIDSMEEVSVIFLLEIVNSLSAK